MIYEITLWKSNICHHELLHLNNDNYQGHLIPKDYGYALWLFILLIAAIETLAGAILLSPNSSKY